MSASSAALIAFLALVLLLGVVPAIALLRAKPEDVPKIMSMFLQGFSGLTGLLSRAKEQQPTPAPATVGDKTPQTPPLHEVVESQARALTVAEPDATPPT
jgi:hypothetical protein